MNHSDVISQGLVEKYFLQELTAEQHDAFEQHCFECTECAAELKTLYAVRESVRRTPPVRVEITQPLGWMAWVSHPAVARLSLAAALGLAGVVAYQNLFTLPTLSAALESPSLMQTLRPGGERRGSASASRVEYVVPLRFREGFTAYRIDVRAQDGSVIRTLETKAEDAQASDGIRLPRDKGLQGKVEIVVSGLNASFKPEELSRYVLDIP